MELKNMPTNDSACELSTSRTTGQEAALPNMPFLRCISGRAARAVVLAKQQRTPALLAGLGLCAALLLGGAVPATQPAGSPASTDNNSFNSRSDRSNRRGRGSREAAPVVSASDPFSVLKTRSIFVKGNQNISSESRGGGGFTGPVGPLSGRSENSLVFNGVIIVDGEADALVEDLGSGNVVKVRPGDAIAGGRVSTITFDDLAYERGSRTQHVEIGQNLEGVTASVPTPVAATPTTLPAGAAPDGQTSVTAPAGASPGGIPPGGGSTVVPPGASGETSITDIEAKLKARRLQESGGK